MHTNPLPVIVFLVGTRSLQLPIVLNAYALNEIELRLQEVDVSFFVPEQLLEELHGHGRFHAHVCRARWHPAQP